MSPTFATLIFVPLLAWGVRKPERLLLLLAATVGFSGTAVLNVAPAEFGLQPYHLFGLALVARAVLEAAVDVAERRWRSVPAPVLALVALWLVAAASFANAAVGGGVSIVLAAQLGHLGFGVAVVWAIQRQCRRVVDVERAALAFERGAVFAAGWALFQFACHLTSLPYPAFVFNNSVGRYADKFGSVLDTVDVVRAGSVATEPSFLARTLVFALCLAVVRRLPAGRSGEMRLVVAACLVGGLALSTSATGVLGLAAVGAVGVVLGRRVALRVPIAVAALLLLVALLAVPTVRQTAFESTLGKLDSFSFRQRFDSIAAAWDVFVSHPVLGTGLGSQTSHDVAGKVASNLGLAGIFALVWALFRLFGFGVGGAAGSNRSRLGLALRVALGLSVLLDAVAGWSYTYGDFWVLAGLLVALGKVADGAAAPEPVEPVAAGRVAVVAEGAA